MLAESPGEAAEGAASAGSGHLAFEPADSSHAQPGLAGEFFLRQATLPTEMAELPAVEDERLGLGGTGAFTVRVQPGGTFAGDHEDPISYQTVQPACSSPLRPQSRANWATM